MYSRYPPPDSLLTHQGWQGRRPQPKADCWIGTTSKAPQGKGRGVGPSPDASKGKGQKFAKDWKGGKEAPAGKGRGVGPNPYASKGKDSKGGTEAHGKGKKGGKAGGKGYHTKRRDMTQEEKQGELKRHRANVISRRTDENYVVVDQWNDGFRTPLAHRFGHKRPKECSRATGAFSKILPKAAVHQDFVRQAFDSVYNNFESARRAHEAAAKAWVDQWLEARHFGDARKISHVGDAAGKQALCRAPLWRGGPTFDSFVGNSACELPPGPDPNGKYITTDFYFTEFDPDMWETFKHKDKRKFWLQWHGTNFYSLSAILALNYVGVSKSADKGHELAVQRGVYTSHYFDQAAHFATPHMVQKEEGRGVGPNLMREAPPAGQPTDPRKREDVIKSCAQILVRVQLLVMVPGDASPKGVGIFHQLPDNGWVYEGDATELEKFGKWQLTTLPEDLDIQAPLGPKDPEYNFSMKEHKGIDPTQPRQWKREAALQRRLAPPNNEKRHIVYTNISNTLEQCISSQAHVVGFAISYHDYLTHNSYYGTKKNSPG